MSDGDPRARFDAALDGELDALEQAAFDAALARDPELRAAFARHREVVEATRALGAPPVDLLAAVQEKLRARSGGKFYRDRFAQRQGRGASVWIMVGACAVLAVLVALWLAYDAGLF